MRHAIRWMGFAGLAAFLALAAGCAAPNYVYKPSPAAAGGKKVPAKVAVLPFTDGTENFTKRGSMLGDGQFNLAKAGISGGMTAMPPEFWGKSFADELTASRSFQAVRFVYSPAEAAQDDYLVDGTLKKVICAATFDYPNELLVTFRATRKSDRQVVWEKEAGRTWKTPRNLYAGCGMGMQCLFDKMHDDWNQWMGGLLAEARADLVETLASPAGAAAGGAGAIAEGKTAGAAGESVEQTIDKILKGK